MSAWLAVRKVGTVDSCRNETWMSAAISLLDKQLLADAPTRPAPSVPSAPHQHPRPTRPRTGTMEASAPLELWAAAARGGYVGVLLLLNVGLADRLAAKLQLDVKAAVAPRLKYLHWAHGFLTYAVLGAVQPANLAWVVAALGGRGDGGTGAHAAAEGIVRCGLLALLAVVLWDLGIVWEEKWWRFALGNCHHAGLFVAVWLRPADGADPRAEAMAAWDTCLYGWLWVIHSFGFLLELVFPLLGLRYAEGERSHLLDGVKHVYSAVTVYLYHGYFNAAGQPGLGWNYQTLSLLLMLAGRYTLAGTHVDFLRRVEMPGFCAVALDHVFFRDAALERGFGCVLAAFLVYLTHAVLVRTRRASPARYVPPAEHAELRAFLARERAKVENVGASERKQEAAMREVFVQWVRGQKDKRGVAWAGKYPLLMCVVKNDLPGMRALLDKDASLANQVACAGGSGEWGYRSRLECAVCGPVGGGDRRSTGWGVLF